MAEQDDHRSIIAVTGTDRRKILQDLVTNDVPETGDGLVYAALLTPQGKYLADFFLLAEPDRMLIDVASQLADSLLARLNMYKLRADVSFDLTDIQTVRGLGDAPEFAWPDPRHPELGWRAYGDQHAGETSVDWAAIRVKHCIPETGVELIANETFILEAGFERLNGVNFKKGCYVGQEVTARMKHKTELKKGFAVVQVDGSAPVGAEITANGKPAGTLFTQSGGSGIAYLRFARTTGPMQAGDAAVRYDPRGADNPS